MKNPTNLKNKLYKSTRAISKIISVLLMIAIAIAAALVAYSWIMGYLGSTTQKTELAIQIQSVTNTPAPDNFLVIYVQNVGKGLVHLKQDTSVYVNDYLRPINECPKDTPTSPGEILPIQVTETSELIMDYQYFPGNYLKVKVVTTEGTFAELTIQGTKTTENPPTPPGTSYRLTLNVIGTGTVTKHPNYATYQPGETVQLIPQATDVGWQFSHWSGDITGIANPATITMSSHKTVTATFTQKEYTLEILLAGSGTGTVAKNPDQPNYHRGNQVQLTATANPGSTFVGWTGGVTSTSNPVTVTINDNTQVTATFTQTQYSLTVTPNPTNGGTVTRNKYDPYVLGDVVTLTANPEQGFTFAGWTGDLTGTTNPTTITITGNMLVTANFAKTPVTLTLTSNPSTAGSIIANPIGTYYYGDVVQLTVISNPGYSFATWSQDLSGSTNPTQITLNGNKAVTANFNQNEYSLDISIVGNGDVTKNPNQATYHIGNQVQLTANPSQGWQFAGWTGDASGTSNPVTITIDENPQVTATFTQTQYTLTATSNPENGGNVALNNNGPYTYNTVVTLTANPTLGYTFTGWTGDLTGTTNPTTITITGNMLVTANFAKTPVTLTLNVNPANKGTINANPIGPYYYGDIVQLTAVPTDGYSFGSWSGDLSGSTNPTQITLNGNKAVTANFNQNPQQTILSSNFDGANWDIDWDDWGNPPWYRAQGQGYAGTTAAKSDPYGNNEGPFTCDRRDASSATVITITFKYRVLNTDSANDLRILYSGIQNPNSGPNSPHFTVLPNGNIGLPGSVPGATPLGGGWYEITTILTRTSNPDAFTANFRLRFESDLSTRGGGIVEQVWVDDVVITITL